MKNQCIAIAYWLKGRIVGTGMEMGRQHNMISYPKNYLSSTSNATAIRKDYIELKGNDCDKRAEYSVIIASEVLF